MLKIILASLMLLAAGGATASTVYKWVDEKGIVNYTTTPPPASRKSAAVDVAPAVEGKAGAGEEEARYWRARAEREAAHDLALARQRRETESLAQEKLRRELAASEKQTAKQLAQQAALERCKAERRVDCDTNLTGLASNTYAYAPVVVVGRSNSQPVLTGPSPTLWATPYFTPGFSEILLIRRGR